MAPKARVQKRLYYKIGEACKALGIQPYVLRYWETEFPALSPSKSRSGQRVYSEKELEVIRRIKQLLYDEGYTIAGAKKKLEGELAAGVLGEPAGVGGPGSLAVPPSAAAVPAAQAAPAAARTPADLPTVDEVRGADAAHGLGRDGGRSANDGSAAGAVGGGAAGSLRAVPLPLVPRAPAPAASPPRAAEESTTAAAAPAPLMAGAEAPTAAGADPVAAVMSALPGPFGLAAVPVPVLPPEVREAGSATTEAPVAAAAGPSRDPRSRDPQENLPTLPLVPPMPAGAEPKPPPAPAAARVGSRQVGAARVPAAIAGEVANRGEGPAAPAGSPPAPGGSGSAPDLDTDAAKQIETLRKGIHRALENAREILALLGSNSPQ